jgi:hypothetical protein
MMARRQSSRKWSAKVTETNDALEHGENFFKSRTAKRIAALLTHAADPQLSPQSEPFLVADVDAESLHQSSRQKPIGSA